MIYIRVELWPRGDKSQSSVLAEATIANVTGAGSYADYDYQIYGKKRAPMGFGRVNRFPRKAYMAWDLIFRVLHQARGAQNGVPFQGPDMPDMQVLHDEHSPPCEEVPRG